MTPRRRNAPAPQPPPGLTAALPNDWVNAWRLVRVQPQVDVPAWDGGEPARVTPSVKSVGLFAATFATWETGADVRPGVDILAQVAGYSAKAVGMALDTACRLGFMWRYVSGSQGGRPGQGGRPLKSTYRLTVPDDILSGRVPLLDPDYGVPEDHPNSDQVISDQQISVPGSPELSSRITRTEFALPIQDPHTDPDMTVVPLAATSVEGSPDRPNSDQVMSGRVIASPLMTAIPPDPVKCAYADCTTPPGLVGDDGYHRRCKAISDAKAQLNSLGERAPQHTEAS